MRNPVIGDEVTIRPACRFEEQIWITYGLARDGETIRGGIPRNPLQLALLFEISETYLPALPLAVQRGICASRQ